MVVIYTLFSSGSTNLSKRGSVCEARNGIPEITNA